VKDETLKMNNYKNKDKSVERLEGISQLSTLNSQLNRGYIALSMVLIISAVVIGVAATVSLLAIGEAQSGLTQFKGEDAWSFVDGCAEDALQKIHDNPSYAGGTISRPEGTCSVTVNAGNPDWDITVTTNESNPKYKRTVQIQATRGSTITITSWKEI